MLHPELPDRDRLALVPRDLDIGESIERDLGLLKKSLLTARPLDQEKRREAERRQEPWGLPLQ